MAQRYINQAGNVKNRSTALILCARNRNINIARLIVHKEARLADDNGWTALMWAEDTQQADMIKLLAPLEAKMQDKNGLTALMWAAQSGKFISAKLLFDFEGDVLNGGKPVSQYAFENG